jgi:hypothetical protein
VIASVSVPILGIASVVVAALVGFGAAWLGARLQRTSGDHALALQLQIDAAAKFLAAVGETFIPLALPGEAGAKGRSNAEQPEPAWIALVDLRVQASALPIVGPDALSDIAKAIEGQALIVDYSKIVGAPDRVAAQKEVGRLTAQFENEARRLLRPSSRQKNGRNPGFWQQMKGDPALGKPPPTCTFQRRAGEI